MRSPDDEVPKVKNTDNIPDMKGSFSGLLGVKAPAGYKQGSDIEDRLIAAGILKVSAPTIKR